MYLSDRVTHQGCDSVKVTPVVIQGVDSSGADEWSVQVLAVRIKPKAHHLGYDDCLRGSEPLLLGSLLKPAPAQPNSRPSRSPFSRHLAISALKALIPGA
jgi:hypothetical protein